MTQSEEAPPPPDSQINKDDGLQYWQHVGADVDGMLGGFPQISRADLMGSRTFLAQLGIGTKKDQRVVSRALEGGAGCVFLGQIQSETGTDLQ